MKLLFDTKYILCIRDTETLTVMDRLMCQLKAGTFLVTGVRPADFNVRTEKPEFIVIFSLTAITNDSMETDGSPLTA